MSNKKLNQKPVDKSVKQLNPEEGNTSPEKATDNTGTEAASKPEGPQQQPGPAPKYFTMSREQLDEVADCINSVVGNKYAKQTIFNCLNGNITPVM